jgi:hypothetical protein
MQKKNRKCYQISHTQKQCDAARRPRSSEGHQRENIAEGGKVNYETSHCSKEEDYSSYLPTLTKKHKKFGSCWAEWPPRFNPRISNLHSNLPVVPSEGSPFQCQKALVRSLWQGSCKILGVPS